MGSETRHKEYEYQYKTIALQNARDCGYGSTLNFNLPANFMAIKNLWVHVRIVFDAAEPVGNRKIIGIGPKTWPVEGAQPLMKPLNLTADANRRIDFTADLTEIINQLVVTNPSLYQQGFIGIGLQHPNALSNIATIEIWKTDLVYTTQGIR